MPFLKHDRITPAQVVILGFLFQILIGAGLLSLPVATRSGERVPFLDALFTATGVELPFDILDEDDDDYDDDDNDDDDFVDDLDDEDDLIDDFDGDDDDDNDYLDEGDLENFDLHGED